MRMKSSILAVTFILSIAMVSCGGGGKRIKDKDIKKGPSNRGRAQGYATIFDNDKSLARDRATDDAKSKLVRKILGETISGRSLMKDFELVSNIVEAKSTGLVKNLEIIESKQGGNEMFVTIEGTVEAAAINDAIQAALENYGRPKFMVLIRESFEGKRNLPGFTETELIMQEVMGDSGFEFVDAAMTQQMMKRERSKMNNAMNGRVNSDVQQLLLNTVGAEVLIIGTATTRDQSAAMRRYSKNMKSKSAIIRIKAVDVYTGRILATMSRNAPGVHIENETASKKAIENALKKILGKMDRNTEKFKTGKFINTIIKKFVKAASQREINIFLTGLDYKGLSKFRNNISQRIRGVSKVQSKGQVGRAARVLVYFAGKTNDFTDELLAKADKMGYSITIKETYPNKIIMTVKKQ